MNINTLILTALLTIPLFACAQDVKDQMKAYPAAEENFDRFVFYVPPLEDESTRKIELIAGKTMTVDCNQTALNGSLEKRVVEGWGYPYYIVEKIDGQMSTRMACPPERLTEQRFVTLGGNNQLHRYNSKLPVVVYVPTGYQVRYRIWSTENTMLPAASE